jgi:PAS domain S-box-containing protein
MARPIRQPEFLADVDRGGDAMLEAVASSAERLLLASDWTEAIDDVLLRLGAAAGTSRAYLIRVDADADGSPATQLAEWCAPGVTSQFDNPTLTGSPLERTGFSRWVEVMGRGDTIHGVVATFPPSEREELRRQDIVSIAAFPIFVEGRWWGFVGFDDCRSERDWTTHELDALRAVAGMLGAAEQARRSEARRREAEARYRQLIDDNPAVTYTEELGPDGPRLTFVSPQVEELLGQPSERILLDPSLWFDATHPDDAERVARASADLFHGGDHYDETFRMRGRDGAWVWVRDVARPVRDAGGTVVHWQGFLLDVTERVETEGRLRDAEARYRAMVERIPAVTYTDLVDDDGETYMGFVSPQIGDILGHPPERFLEDASFWFSIMHPDDLAFLRSIDAFNNSDLRPFDHEYRMRHADGHWVWVHDISTAVLDEDGRLEYFLGFLTDISRSKDAEERLREAEVMFRTLVEQNPAVFYVQEVDPDDPTRSITTYVGPGDEELTGYPRQASVTDPLLWQRLIHPDDRERILAADATANLNGTGVFSEEYRLVRKDGRVVWVLDEARLVRREGKPPVWQGFQLDITARKEAEQRLQDAHAHLRLMVESSLDAIVTMDADGAITGWNPQAEATFGWARDEAIGRPLVETIVPHDRRAEHVEGLRRWRETGEGAVLNSRIEVQALHRDGRQLPVELAIIPVKVGDETVFSGFIRDISDRKRSQEELERALEVERKAADRLRMVDEMKDAFLQAVSHDLRTPLAAILGLAITLERGDVELSTEETKHLAGRIEHNARRLERLVTNLLDLDRLSRGVLTATFEPVDVGELARRMVAEADPAVRERVRLSVEPVVVPADPPKIERIMENLLVNASRHTPEGTPIHVSVTETDDGALLVVEDEGAGVPDELRERIFEEFRQGTDAPQASPGVGIGLALVRRFAQMHHGRAWVEGREGGGASFRVFLPKAHPNGKAPAGLPGLAAPGRQG